MEAHADPPAGNDTGAGFTRGPGTQRFAGLPLDAPVEIVVDRWGVPHIYAQSVDDVFVAQGFNVGRDRLFQIDLWRRRGLGRLAEVLGSDYVDQDRAARLFRYRGDYDADWSCYGPRARRIAERFVAGINAYVDWVTEHPADLPPEFGRLDYQPAKWEPDDLIRIRSHGIAANVRSEVARARTARVGSAADDLIRRRLEPTHVPVVPDGLDLRLPEDVLAVYDQAVGGVALTDDPDHPIRTGAGPHEQGSNNWVVAGERTATGRPILAGDPHRALATPSLRYIAHLSAPGLDVIGAGEPAIPGISIGHNGTSAFAFTIFPIDNEDLYVYDLDPGDPGRYRYGDGWESFVVEREAIEVKAGEPRTVELLFTRHGPVIHRDESAGKAYAVRTTWLEPGTAAYLGSLAYLDVVSWDQFVASLDGYGAPGENLVYADVHGTIGWKPAGLVPRRVGYDGLLPVPGDGRYEWDGFYSTPELPIERDPARGFIATANEYNLPADYPADRQLSYEWNDPVRYRRIAEVLATQTASSLADMARLQTDVVSVTAREVVSVLAGIDTDHPAEKAALSLLTGWDAAETADSAAAALYEVWMTRHLRPAVARALLPAHVAETIGAADAAVARAVLADPGSWLRAASDVRSARDDLVRATLRAAFEEVSQELGPDPAAWRWGDLHQRLLPHALGGLDARWDVGPVPAPGSSTTVNVGTYRSEDFRQTSGASFRMVLDVGAWDNSLAINTPGQGGDPRSPHYRDLAGVRDDEKYFPLLYSRDAVDEAASRRLWLLP